MKMLSDPYFYIILFSVVPMIVCLTVFINLIRTDPRTLKLGRWGIFSAFFIFVSINLLLLYLNGQGVIPEGVLIIEAITLVMGFLIFSVVIFIGIIVESIKVWRRESHSIANLLLPLSFLAFWLMGKIISKISNLPPKYDYLKIITYVYPILIMYIGWQFIVFFASSVIYGWLMKRAKANYFVVLGAGLINGDQIGKLLGSRIEVAVNHSKKQQEKAQIIFSGGQGPDELVPEAVAMRNYAVQNMGYPEDHTVLEDKSRTTYENLVFSSRIIEQKSQVIGEKFLFFSSEYHVFRAALFARELGLNAQGIGSKTAMYYRIPAFIREFIAVLNSNKKKHLKFLIFILILNILLVLFTNYITRNAA